MKIQNDVFDDVMSKAEFCASIPGGPITERTADRWAKEAIGPPRIRIGHRVFYHRAAVRAWFAERIKASEASR